MKLTQIQLDAIRGMFQRWGFAYNDKRLDEAVEQVREIVEVEIIKGATE